MKAHPVLTVVIVLALVLTTACAPRVTNTPPAAPQPETQAAEVVEHASAENGPAENAAPLAPEDASAQVDVPTQAREKEPLPALALDAPQGSKPEAAARLAEGLSAAADALEAYPLVVELLAWNGIPVYDSLTGALLVPVVEPAAEVGYFDFEAYGFALDHVNGNGLMLSEVAEALVEAETTLGGAPVSADFLEDLLARWVTAARELDPESWEAFTPIYLAESALRKPFALDLSYPGYDGADLHYSHLEWLLFFAAQVRTGREVPPALAAVGGGGVLAAPLRVDMCTLYQKALSKLGDYVAGEVNSATGDALGTVIEESAEGWGGKAGTAGKWVGKGLGWFMAVLSLVANSTAWRIDVRGEPDPSHYKHNESDDKYSHFVARVTLEEKWPEWLGSCMKGMGMDVPSQDAVKGAKIRWRGVYGFPKHAVIMADGLNGQLESRFDAAGETRLKVKLSKEKDGDWLTASQKDDYLKVRVELLFDSKFPGPSTWIAAGAGGPLGASAPTLAQWYQRWFPEKAYGVMTIQYHKNVPMVFERKVTYGGVETTVKGYNCKGPYGDWVVEFTRFGETGQFIMDGSGKFTGHVNRDEVGSFKGTMNMSFHVKNPDVPVSGSVDVNSEGEMKIVGTEQAPVLQMKALGSTGEADATAPGIQVQSPFSGPSGTPVGFLLKESPDDPRCK